MHAYMTIFCLEFIVGYCVSRTPAPLIFYDRKVYKSILNVFVLSVHLLRIMNGNTKHLQQVPRLYDFAVALADLKKLNWFQQQKRMNV